MGAGAAAAAAPESLEAAVDDLLSPAGAEAEPAAAEEEEAEVSLGTLCSCGMAVPSRIAASTAA
jgi:hypothetical protein